MSSFVQSLSKGLFWDVDPETVDEVKHRRFIIQRVLERGDFEDMCGTFSHYSIPVVVAEAQAMRSLTPSALSLAACLGNVKEDSFRCYISNQSSLRPWNC